VVPFTPAITFVVLPFLSTETSTTTFPVSRRVTITLQDPVIIFQGTSQVYSTQLGILIISPEMAPAIIIQPGVII